MHRTTSARTRTITAALLPASAFALTLFLFSPARVFIGNFMEFSFLLRQSMLPFLVLSAALAAGLTVALLALARRPGIQRTLIALLTASALMAWIQGNFLLWSYGVLGGKEIQWSSLARYGIIDSAIWIAVLAFAVVKARMVVGISRYLGAALLVAQLVSALWGWMSMPRDQGFKQREINEDTLFVFSEHANVIVLVLDTFQADLFPDIMAAHPDLKDSFDGFTWFRNSLAGSDGTSVSIPDMLTASNYDNSVPYLQYVKESFLENSLPKTLKGYRFTIDLDPILPYSVYGDFSGIASSRRRLMNWGAFLGEEAFIMDLALFRSAPHFLRELIYNRQHWFLSGAVERLQDAGADEDGPSAGPAPSYGLKYAREFENTKQLLGKNRDARFIRRMIRRSSTTRDTDAFKFYHLNGIHTALVMNEDLEYGPMSPDRAGMTRQGTGILKIAAMFLERLRQLGVYDDSLIFIVGDHGSGLSSASIDVTPYGSRFNRAGPYRGFFQNFKSAGIPLILVKRMHARGELTTSNAPVSLGDIPQTVVEQLRLRGGFPGKSMFRVKEGERRERIYRAFVGAQEDIQYLAPLWEYAVDGFSWDDRNWRETGKVYYPKGK